MLTKNLTTKEMYASIPVTKFVVDLFEKGLEIHNDRLAISAMEELILREDTDFIAYSLNRAFEKGQISRGSTMVAMIGRSLKEGCRDVDGVLCLYGGALLRGDFEGPLDWVKHHAHEWVRCPKSGYLKRSKIWARQFFPPQIKDTAGSLENLDRTAEENLRQNGLESVSPATSATEAPPTAKSTFGEGRCYPH